MKDQKDSPPDTAIVGIGASAGGLEALKQFFSCTRDDSGLAYVVVVHLTPEHPSMLADLLQPHVSMPVQQVTEDLPVEPNNVYVIPPASNLSTIDSHLRLSKIEQLREMLERHVGHMTRLVDDLLDVSRIKSGRIDLQLRRVDLRDPVRSAVADISDRARAADLRLITEQATEPLPVDGDGVRLGQLLTNLLDNAIKYTPAGGEIRLTSRREGNEAVVAIRDTGIGLAPEMLSRIFDLFVQGPRNPAHAPGGLGLGLTLVRRLAELHGGSVTADSEGPGTGSEFTLRLPLARQRPAASAETKAETDVSATAESVHRRVLIVDDVPDIAYSLSLALELAGHDVRQAHSGREALDIAEDFKPEVVILDIGLPDMDGYALARALRERPATADARLIAVSGYGQDSDRHNSRAVGIDYHLAKPADLKELLALMAG